MKSRCQRLCAEDIPWESSREAHPTFGLMDLEDIAVAALQESQSYRMLALQTLHLLHAQAVQLRVLSRRNRELLEQFRSAKASRSSR